MEKREVKYSRGGIPCKVITYIQDGPVEQFLKIGRNMAIKKFMERPVALTQEQKIQKAALVKRFEQDFGPDAYLNSSQGK